MTDKRGFLLGYRDRTVALQTKNKERRIDKRRIFDKMSENVVKMSPCGH